MSSPETPYVWNPPPRDEDRDTANRAVRNAGLGASYYIARLGTKQWPDIPGRAFTLDKLSDVDELLTTEGRNKAISRWYDLAEKRTLAPEDLAKLAQKTVELRFNLVVPDPDPNAMPELREARMTIAPRARKMVRFAAGFADAAAQPFGN